MQCPYCNSDEIFLKGFKEDSATYECESCEVVFDIDASKF